jgi:DNA ligase-associated metallophosphoesterase
LRPPPPGAAVVTAGGCELWLLPQRAAFAAEAGTLLVADAHLGKAQAFRRLGVPVPEATTADNLARLDALLAVTAARRIVFLGDLLHARAAREGVAAQAVRAWRACHPGTALTLVRGNHDRGAGDPPPDWGVEVVDAPWRLGGLALCHEPQAVDGAYALAGHVHPGIVLGRGADRLRLPCFHLGPAVGVLPAFGSFTGLHPVQAAPGERVYAVAGDEVRPLLTLSA